ncbi:MAG: hypothetical protein ACI8ZB_004119 [Desulforhopalus sp.]|jgi:hypothetical protein
MKYIFTFLTACLFLLPSVTTATPLPSAAPLLPESLAARSELASTQKTFTIFLKEDDPAKLTEFLNSTNEEYAQKGWSVFSIISYINNGDVDGLFVTYQKGLTVE